jgi:Na+/H+ antiporter NhaD/arsenite permease-like protein
MLGPIPVDFTLFALTLLGVAVFHRRTFTVAGLGLLAIVAYQLAFTRFRDGAGLDGLFGHFSHEWVGLANLFLLLLGFAVLSRHFEMSRAPEAVPALLPSGWLGALNLLGLVFVLSAFLDNIAAALIGGVVARHVFFGRVHLGYLVAIVAAANAGGAGSVVGDTTTTMMWIAGHSPLDVLHAYVGSIVAFAVFAPAAARMQHGLSPMETRALAERADRKIDWVRLGVVAFILLSAVAANIGATLQFPAMLDRAPVIGLAVWLAILIAAPLRGPDWKVVSASLKGAVFLLFLVAAASLMPVEQLPDASWPVALGLGFVSSVFDNIPLTALALKQGGYDWGMLAFAVGFGGSMVWFGSSAGVALANQYPEAKSVIAWVRQGWPVALGYVVGFFALLATLGWRPDGR